MKKKYFGVPIVIDLISVIVIMRKVRRKLAKTAETPTPENDYVGFDNLAISPPTTYQTSALDTTTAHPTGGQYEMAEPETRYPVNEIDETSPVHVSQNGY